MYSPISSILVVIVALPSESTSVLPTVFPSTVTFTYPLVIGSLVSGSRTSTVTVVLPAVLFVTTALISLSLGDTVTGTVMFVPLCTSSPG